MWRGHVGESLDGDPVAAKVGRRAWAERAGKGMSELAPRTPLAQWHVPCRASCVIPELQSDVPCIVRIHLLETLTCSNLQVLALNNNVLNHLKPLQCRRSVASARTHPPSRLNLVACPRFLPACLHHPALHSPSFAPHSRQNGHVGGARQGIPHPPAGDHAASPLRGQWR